MTLPLVSVVVPVYNGAKFLAAAIDSVLAQTYESIELILVDDGSTDESQQVINSYGSRVVSVKQKNAGVANARNAGIMRARGEFVAFLDQDDWWAPEKVEIQVRLFQGDDRIGLVHTGARYYNEVMGEFVEPLNPNSHPEELVGHCYNRLLLGNSICNSSVMLRKSVLDMVGGFDAEICGNTVQDYDLWLRCAVRNTFAYVPEKLLVYRLHPDQGLWNRREMVEQELRLLMGQRSDLGGTDSRRLGARIATLWYSLGIAHLDASERKRARSCFAQSLRTRWSARIGMLYVASSLPQWAVDGLRSARARLSRATRRDPHSNLPAWVSRHRDASSSSRPEASTAVASHHQPKSTRQSPARR